MKKTPHIKQLALALTLTCLSSGAVFAALVPPPITTPSIIIPGISQPVVNGAVQPSNGLWDNVIPNALADYFTYVPYSNADAVALGFPVSCGNPAHLTPNPDPALPPTVLAGDVLSTDDCYTITVKQFQQALSLNGIGPFTGPGLIGANGPLSTRAWGYGSGGSNWTPPYLDSTKGVLPGTTVTGNAPAPFANGTLGSAGIWHFPAPTIKGAFGRPIRIQWLNELPNVAPTGLDPSVDCGPNAPNCFPYNRITTHVHGAHTTPESDGLASAWFTPNFAIVGEDFVSTRQHGPEGTYYYPMDQEASTIWYHDHAMGTTHNNTNMGMAGFFPITDANEQNLIANNILPTGAYELGFALQDRHFDYATGNMVMPDYPLYDLTAAGCTLDVNGLPNPKNCPLVPYMMSPDGTHLIPYNDPTGLTPVLGGTSATLEYFGNIPVVNGVVYGSYSVEPRVYRMRFIGGTDSRTWVMKLTYTDAAGIVQSVPFWQIGTEQGLLNNPLQRNVIDLMPGERVDVLVDFKGIPAGTRVMMQNLGGDAPWPGYFDYLAGLVVPSVDIPNIMAFNVGTLTAPDTITPPSASTNLRPLLNPVPPNGALPPVTPAPTPRVVSLMEITDVYGRTMPTIDSRGFKPAGVPVTEIIKLNDTEQWDIVNTTVDAHPMHLHQVAFKVINRQLIDPKGFVPPTDNILTQVFTPPTYTVAKGSLPIVTDPWDDGWKDTVATPPGYVTRVWAKFDIPGEYVWHCHILSHEEHDMMRNFIVTNAAFSAPTPASITVSPVTGTGLYTVNWVGTAIAGVTYELQEATDSAFATAATVQNTVAPSFTPAAAKPAGTYYYQVRSIPPVASGFTTSTWRTAANPVEIIATPTALAAIGVRIPAVKNKLDTANVNLTWADNSATETGFTLERSTDKKFAAGTVITSFPLGANVTSFTDTTVMTGTTYSYRIKATSAFGSSAYSLPVTLKTP
jgi:spore coat protein A